MNVRTVGTPLEVNLKTFPFPFRQIVVPTE